MPVLDPPRGRAHRRAPSRLLALLAIAAIVLAACQSAAGPPRTITLQTLNDSGVTGTVSFSDVGEQDRGRGDGRSRAATWTCRPTSIPGTCDNLTPQPKYPLENVRDGVSKTVVPASIDELFAGDLAVNIHKSNDDLKTYTACVDIR